jgi:hypothetical protein
MSKGGKNYGCDGFFPKRPGRRGTGVHGSGLAQWASGEGYDRVMEGTFNAQTNIDVRVVATVDRYLEALGVMPRGISEFLKICLQGLLTEATNAGIEPIADVEEALVQLRSRGYRLDQFDGRKKGRLGMALHAQEHRLEMDQPNFETNLGGLAATYKQPRIDREMENEANKIINSPWIDARAKVLAPEYGVSIQEARIHAINEFRDKTPEEREELEKDYRSNLARDAAKAHEATTANYSKQKAEAPKDRWELRLEAIVIELYEKNSQLAIPMDGNTIALAAQDQLKKEKKEYDTWLTQNAPQTEEIMEIVPWLAEQGLKGQEAVSKAHSIIDRRRKQREAIEAKTGKKLEKMTLQEQEELATKLGIKIEEQQEDLTPVNDSPEELRRKAELRAKEDAELFSNLGKPTKE